MRSILKDSTGNRALIYITDDATDGKPKTGVAYNASGLEIWIKPLGGTAVQLTLSSGNWAEGKHGEYEVTIPDSYYTTLATYSITGKITGGDVVGEIHKVVAVNDGVAAFGGNTTTPPTAATVASQVRTELATELGRLDAAVSTRSTLTAAQVWANATRSLTTIADSSGVTTLLSRITGLLRTKAEDDATDSTLLEAIEDAQEAIADLQTDVDDLQMRPSFDPSTDTVTVGTNQDKTGYSLTQTFPDNFSTLAIDGDGKVTTANPATEGGEIVVNPTPVTVNPTVLSTDSVNSLRDGLATSVEVATLAGKVDTLLGRVTGSVATLWANLAAMITGSGTGAAWTATALANAPAGDGGSGGGGGGGGWGGSRGATIVRRSTSDQTPIRFIWPTAGATITAARQAANGSYQSTAGSVEFFGTESGEHWYRLTYNAADRPEADGTIRYRFTAGGVTRYLFLHQFSAGSLDTDELVAGIVAGFQSANVQITRIGPEFDPATSTVTLIAGDDYLVENDAALTFGLTLPGINLAGATAVFSAEKTYAPLLPGNAELIDTDTGQPKLRLTWTREQTNTKPSDKYAWGAAIIDSAGLVKTIIAGPLILKPPAVNPAVVNKAIAAG